MSTAVNIGTLVTHSPDIGDGRAVITETRTSVRRVVVLYKQGANAEEIARRMSHLSLAQVYAALAYYPMAMVALMLQGLEKQFSLQKQLILLVSSVYLCSSCALHYPP
jgi:uncharacterized protein (DUF433 family)